MITVIGASMLWVGWFGFNAGSALAADGVAGMAMLVTQVATAAAAVAWMVVEWIKHGKASVLGVVTGAVGGMVAITPASGSVGPLGAIAIGAAAGVLCFWGATSLKQRLGYDDSLDVFGVHGIGGMAGAVLTGVFAAESLGGQGFGSTAAGLTHTMGSQVWAQIVACWSPPSTAPSCPSSSSRPSTPSSACASRRRRRTAVWTSPCTTSRATTRRSDGLTAIPPEGGRRS